MDPGLRRLRHRRSLDAGMTKLHEPKSNTGYWGPKLDRNKARDAANARALRALGWKALVIWDCETRDTTKTAMRIRTFLGPA